MKPTKHTITVNGLNVAYYELGHGEPLLFLHGGRVRARTFKRLLSVLSERYTVIAPDIPGFGSSDTPTATWSFIEYATFFDSFLEQLNLNAVTVMGYSMGGGIAANLAASSGRVLRLILMDASGIRREKKERGYHDGRRLRFYLKHPRHVSALGVLLRDYTQYTWKHRSDHKHMQQIRTACFETSYEDAIQRITVPTRLFWGSNDWIYPLSIAGRFQNLIPQATLETVPGNHDWPVYEPLLLRQLVL